MLQNKKVQLLFFIALVFSIKLTQAQTLLVPDRVFDGMEMHENWVIYVVDNQIEYAGEASKFRVPNEAAKIDLKGMTLMPGLIEGHSHLLLHPYNETEWNDQVLKESPVERAIRGSVAAKASLLAGITSMRDLGAEGAGYTDVYLKKTIDDGIIPGPRLKVAGPAIVATGAYGPKGFHDGVTVPLGAEPVSGIDDAIKAVRRQLGNGASFIKVYADYRWGKGEPSNPTFLQEELNVMVATAKSAGRYVVAHASTPEGMRRAILAGVETIEHGDGGTLEVFKLMKEKGVAFCPTITAGHAIERYKGWRPNINPDPERITKKKKSIQLALEAGVDIIFGGDVGVFAHGENYRELELMVEYGISPIAALQAATLVNAQLLHFENLGQLKKGFLADIIAVKGNPIKDITKMREIEFVMKDGIIL
ncbi:amidohydrolase family protein [uncultured Croceitalea sp.]|uniref:metal-dependent hydrolase family protein n=1 Tax=uncultured Croceitalea sp. TaxID=1798908 RepID=UPI00374E7082